MANSLKYVIESEDRTKKGLDDANKNLSSFEKQIQLASKSLIALFAADKFLDLGKSIGKFGADCVSSFAEVEVNAIRLQTVLGQITFRRFEEFSDSIAKISSSDADDILKIASNLAALGRTEPQIKKVIEAANNLANATGTSIGETWKQVNATLEGTGGKLDKLVTGFSSLTKEELKAGKGLDLINEKMGDVSIAIGESTKIKIKNLSASFGDLKEAIGEGLAPNTNKFIDFVEGIISKWKDATKEVNTYNAAIAKGKTKSIQDEYDIKSIDLNRAKRDKDTNIKTQVGDFQNWIKQMRLTGVQKYQYNSSDPNRQKAQEAQWQSEYKEIVDAFNSTPRQVELQNKIDGLTKEVSELSIKLEEAKRVEQEANTAASNLAEGQRNYVDKQGEAIDKLKRVEEVAKQSRDEYWNDFDKHYQRKMEIREKEKLIGPSGGVGSNDLGLQNIGLKTDMFSKLGRELTNIFTKASFKIQNLFSKDTVSNLFSGFTSQMGELGTIIQFVTQAAGPLGIVIWAVSKIISGMLSVLQPVIDSLLAPLVGILTIIGQTLGQLIVPVLKIFEPVLTLVVNMFVFFYNALRPVFELIHDVFSMIGAVVGKVVGTILYSIGKMLEFVDDLPVINIPNGYETMISQGSDLMNADIFEAFKTTTFEKIDTSAVTKTGMSAISANNSGSNSSTYSGVRDVTVNNYFSGFVNGDEEKIALRIWEIIKRKDALNLT